jgi:anti-anti-sigma factor
MFKRSYIDGIQLLTLSIENLDSSNARTLCSRLDEAKQVIGPVILDLGRLKYFDVAGFAALLGWISRLPPSVEIRLCSKSGTVHSLFELLRGHSVLALYHSKEVALLSFERKDMAQSASA